MIVSEVNFKLLEAEQLASKIIDEYGIISPEDISIRDIAFDKGARIIEHELLRATASLVKAKEFAVIRVSPNDKEERKRFSIAHELGHLLMGHITSIKKVCHYDDMMSWYQSSQETQANFFASELILPSKIVGSFCDVEEISFKPIELIAREFRTSLTATAIKFVRLCPEKCAVIYSKEGKIKWFYKSHDWRGFIHNNKKLDKNTVAYDLFVGEELEAEPVEVDADAWIENPEFDEIVEHSILSTNYNFVLTLLWKKP